VVGAIAVQTSGEWGHVAYVEGVSGSNIIVDDSNYRDDLTVRYLHLIPESDFAGYIYGGPAGNGPGSSAGNGPGYGAPGGTPTMVGRPAVVINSSYSNIDVFYRDTNGDLEDDSWSATSGQGYQSRTIASGVTGDPTAVTNSSYSNIDVFYPGTNGQLEDTYWSASSGEGYQTRTLPTG
jgi:surface antigen